jgi:4-hydroxybenzoate polyprenyltransferase
MLAYLQLLRLPTVFTAMADIVLGFVLTHRFIYGPLVVGDDQFAEPALGWNQPAQFVGLLAASCCLYLSGMVFNDVFDRKQDAAERPGRPIPSGRVSVKAAAILGAGLMLAGAAAAATVSLISLQVAGLLIVAILGYDAVLKRSSLGPLAMGSCRFLNVLLGASVQSNWAELLSRPQLATALGLGVFITGVTLFARTEAHVSNRWQLSAAQLIMNIGFVILVGLILTWPMKSPAQVPIAMLAVIAFTVNRRAIEALRDPSPATVQAGIKVMLLSLVVIDSTLVFWYLNTPEASRFAAMHAMATAALVIPAMLLGRVIPMT